MRWIEFSYPADRMRKADVGLTYLAARHHGEHGSISAGGYLLLVAGGLALIWRRRFAVAVLAAPSRP
jgi:hypothetical protein